jgi:4-carboxymuconolactone decarboxylase
MTDNGRYEEGLRVRSEVLGAAHVQRSLESASEFSRPIQELVTEYCWGAVWARPGLARRDRSLINLGMLTALGRSHELAVHVSGAVANGCTKREIQDALLQAAIYCGVPAGMEAFRVVESVIEELEREGVSVAEGDGDVAGAAGGGRESEEHPRDGGAA